MLYHLPCTESTNPVLRLLVDLREIVVVFYPDLLALDGG